MDIDSEEAPEALTQALDTLRQFLVAEARGDLSSSDMALAKAVCAEILVRISLAPKALSAMKDAADVMVTVGADDRALQVWKIFFLAEIYFPAWTLNYILHILN